MKYTELYKAESYGNYGAFGIRFEVSTSQEVDLKNSPIWSAVRDAAKAIESEVMAAVVAARPETALRAQEERAELLSCFPSLIFVEEIPNGYCSDWCCRHLPWFVVTTTIGRFKIGWRKRVIQLDWSETRGAKTAEELFASENVTKGKRDIHAWSIEDARRYVSAIMESAAHQPAERGEG